MKKRRKLRRGILRIERLETRCYLAAIPFAMPEYPFSAFNTEETAEIVPGEEVVVYDKTATEMHPDGPAEYTTKVLVFAEGDVSTTVDLTIDTVVRASATIPAQHNWVYPADVNGDGIATARDALIVVNSLNYRGLGTGPAKPDVNGDGYMSPMDVLLVVNGVNGISFFTSPFANSSMSREMIIELQVTAVTGSSEPANITWYVEESLTGPGMEQLYRNESFGIASIESSVAGDVVVFTMTGFLNGTSGPTGFGLIRDSSVSAIVSTETEHVVTGIVSVSDTTIINDEIIVDSAVSGTFDMDMTSLPSFQMGSFEVETVNTVQLDMLLSFDTGLLIADAIAEVAAGAPGIISGEYSMATAAMEDFQARDEIFGSDFVDSLHSVANLALDPF